MPKNESPHSGLDPPAGTTTPVSGVKTPGADTSAETAGLTDDQKQLYEIGLSEAQDRNKFTSLVPGYDPSVAPTREQIIQAGVETRRLNQEWRDANGVGEDPGAAQRLMPRVPDAHKVFGALSDVPFPQIGTAAAITNAYAYHKEGKDKEAAEALAAGIPVFGKLGLLVKGGKLAGKLGEGEAKPAPPAARPPGNEPVSGTGTGAPAPKPTSPAPKGETAPGPSAAQPGVSRPPDSVHVARPPDSVHVARPPDSVHVARPPDSRMSANKPEDNKKDDGVVYLRTNKDGGKYVGRAKNDQRYEERKGEHNRKNPDARYNFKKIDGAKTEKDLQRKEQENIDAHGGPKTKKNPQGKLENKRNEVSKKRKWW